MNIDETVSLITPEIYQAFRRAVELGKWPDGRQLSQEQRETCMRATIAYEHHYLPPEKRTGYIPPKTTDCAPEAEATDDEQPLNWR